MNLVLIIEKKGSQFCAFAPEIDNCEAIGSSADEVRSLIRPIIDTRLHEMAVAGEPMPAATACLEDIEVVLPPELASDSETYEVVIDKAPRNYAAWVPNLPVCLAVGDTMEEMRSEIKGAMEAHIEWMVEDGDPIPPKTSVVEMIEVDVVREVTVEAAD